MAVVIDAQTASFNKALQQSSGQLNKFSSNVSSTAKQLVAGFGLLEVGKGIIKVTGEFQRFQAVLSNTLGSDSAASRALTNIKDFAAKTPFAVNELTGSFVKLANQGFTPTTDQLRSLGDLASSTGKSFDQLTEAIIDAQTGEFERLKEFGIRAKKSGDDVSFTFKGVTQTVKNTSTSIRDYILSLGDAEGVSGSMAKISDTLEGKISNLGDAWDNLLLTIGNGNSGVLVGAVTALTNLANAAAHAQEELEINNIKYFFKDIGDASKGTLDYITDFLKANSGKKISDIISPVTSQSDSDFFKNFEANSKKFTELLSAQGEDIETINALWKRYTERRLDAKKANEGEDFAKLKKTIDDARISAEAFNKAISFKVGDLKTIDDVQAKIKLVTDIRDSSTGKTLEYYNVKLRDLGDRMKDLQNAGLTVGVISKLNAEISKLEGLKVKTDNIFDLQSINDQINALQTKLETLNNISLSDAFVVRDKTGDQFLKSMGLDDEAINKMIEKIKVNFKLVKETVKTEAIELGSAVSGVITDIATVIGEGLGSGNFSNFGQNLLKAVANFMKQLGALMISLGTAKAVLQFSNNPYVLIAAGAALVIAGAAISSLTAKQGSIVSNSGSLSGGSGGGGNSSVSGALRSTQDREIKLSGQIEIRGKDLVYVLDKQQAFNSRTNSTRGTFG